MGRGAAVLGRGDVVNLSHDLVTGGVTGRLAGISSNVVILDRSVDFAADDTLLLGLPGGGRHQSMVDLRSGRPRDAVLRTPIDPVPEDSPEDITWRLYRSGEEPLQVRIVSMEPGDADRIRVSAIDETDEYMAVPVDAPQTTRIEESVDHVWSGTTTSALIWLVSGRGGRGGAGGAGGGRGNTRQTCVTGVGVSYPAYPYYRGPGGNGGRSGAGGAHAAGGYATAGGGGGSGASGGHRQTATFIDAGISQEPDDDTWRRCSIAEGGGGGGGGGGGTGGDGSATTLLVGGTTHTSDPGSGGRGGSGAGGGSGGAGVDHAGMDMGVWAGALSVNAFVLTGLAADDVLSFSVGGGGGDAGRGGRGGSGGAPANFPNQPSAPAAPAAPALPTTTGADGYAIIVPF